MDYDFGRVHIDITGKCNLRCIHCFASEKYKDHLTTEDVLKIMAEVKSLGIERATISGGEPFLRDDLFEILEEAPKDISILTNATILTDQHIDKLLKLDEKGKFIDMRISLDGVDSYQKVRGISPKYAMNNIHKLLERDFVVVINTTMMPFQKKEELLELYEMLLELGVDQWSLDIPFLAGSAKENNLRTDVKEYADTVVEVAKRHAENKPSMILKLSSSTMGLLTTPLMLLSNFLI